MAYVTSVLLIQLCLILLLRIYSRERRSVLSNRIKTRRSDFVFRSTNERDCNALLKHGKDGLNGLRGVASRLTDSVGT